MQRDYLGNPVTGDNATTLRAVDDFIEGFLAYETRTEGVLEAADADRESGDRQCVRRIPLDAARGAAGRRAGFPIRGRG